MQSTIQSECCKSELDYARGTAVAVRKAAHHRLKSGVWFSGKTFKWTGNASDSRQRVQLLLPIRFHSGPHENVRAARFWFVWFGFVQLQADWRSLTWTENQWIPFRIVLFSLLGTVCCVVCYIRVLAYYFFLFTSAHQFMLFGCKRMRERPKPGAFLSFCGL